MQNPYVACVSPNLQITGAGPGVNNPSIINIPVAGSVTDVNVYINCLHTWVGDLDFTLSHAGVSRVIVDQPGVPATTYGCSGDNIDATLDDAAATAVEGVCSVNAPAIGSPPAYRPNNLLNGFNGTQMMGNWNLVIDDGFSAGDNGTLLQWCVEIAWQ
ncbi:MAG: hypothetical protein HC927_12845 [Deltaproteobacteria bacterium]|nr:hypothetical protein [Deltaproteobacteria bacterium]